MEAQGARGAKGGVISKLANPRIGADAGLKPSNNTIHIPLTPECQRMLQQVQAKIANTAGDGRLTEVDLRLEKAMQRFKSQCITLIEKAARDASLTRGANDLKLQVQYECADRPRRYNERNNSALTPH